ncbi:bucentaur or craniofacial development-domain-containing protein [Phyllosticta citrichinensis]|uniref:SWR1-complex protein 5 n=1 Tax=Phyllosticta citrichinensis TaxID=1130410 RepID=A0ABR1Y6U6_9PEZI
MAELPGLLGTDENYNSASDEEFNPDAVVAAEESSSSDTDDEFNTRATNRKTKTKRKRDAPIDDELDSGDEATITAARKKRRTGKKDVSGGDEDLHLSDADGGEGGLIKTRAQRRTEQKERRPLADTAGATADIDEIWSKLASAPVAKPPEPSPPAAPANGDVQQPTSSTVAAATAREDEETITIKRTYDFAGDRITEERQVPKNSAEARLYLTQQEAQKQQQDQQLSERKSAPRSSASATPPPDGSPATASDDGKPKVRRPLRRPSRFDPNPTGEVKGLPPDKQLTWANRRRLLDPTLVALSPAPHANQGDGMTAAERAAVAGERRLDKAQKLNTVDKSRLDWAGYVDREGIADELDEYGRAKEGYLGRMDFLSRVDERRDAERKAAKMKGVGA